MVPFCDGPNCDFNTALIFFIDRSILTTCFNLLFYNAVKFRTQRWNKVLEMWLCC